MANVDHAHILDKSDDLIMNKYVIEWVEVL